MSESLKNVDLDTLIKNDKMKKQNQQSNQQERGNKFNKPLEIKTAQLNKRQKKEIEKVPFEEVKLSSDGQTVIDLTTFKNNIRNRNPIEKTKAEEHPADDKKKIKCRHYPNCNFSDAECQYFHPKEECPYFPKC